MSTSWPQIEKHVKKIVDVIERIAQSEYVQMVGFYVYKSLDDRVVGREQQQ